jgi:cysteine desulfurase
MVEAGGYFDWNATAPLRPEAHSAMFAALALTGNPSSVHAQGRAARHLVEVAREQVATLVGASPKNVTFTAGGTEANMLALTPAIETDGRKELRDRLLVSTIEHPSVRAGGRFGAVADVPVTADGVVDLAALERLLAGSVRPLVSVMLANNETGAVQPISEVARIVHQAGGLLHVDAVQAAGRIGIDINELQVDLLALSAHKIGGPQGVGALICRRDDLRVAPLTTGGGQERGRRAGTENVAGIAGFGAAAAAVAISMPREAARMAALLRRLEEGLRTTRPDAVVFSDAVERLPNTTLVAVVGMKAETAIIAFDLAGIAVSSGSACSSGKVTPSHVLAAMGVTPGLASAAIRISLGWNTTEGEIDKLLEAWNKVTSSLLKGQAGLAA